MASLKSPQEMFQAMKGNIQELTGKSFTSWVNLAARADISKFKALTDHMKKEHGLSHGYAQMVAWGVLDPARLEAGNQEPEFVDALYSGKKLNLRPIYDKLIEEGLKMGSDVELVICKTYSSLRSKSQYAMVVPKTNSAVDLELALPRDISLENRLETIKNSNPKITHRIRITDLSQIDDDVLRFLNRALENNRG